MIGAPAAFCGVVLSAVWLANPEGGVMMGDGGVRLQTANAQITAPIQALEPEIQANPEPTCDHCGSAIALVPMERDCCHKHTTDIQAMQLDSSRQAGRYVIWLTKRVEQLAERVLELETRPRKGKG